MTDLRNCSGKSVDTAVVESVGGCSIEERGLTKASPLTLF